MHGKRVGITVNRQRYRCKNCGSTFFENLWDMDDKRMATVRLVEYIQNQSLYRTFTSIASEVGMDEKTIRNIFRDYVTFLAETVKFETPRFLGIDEIHILKKPRCVVTRNIVLELRLLPSYGEMRRMFYHGGIRVDNEIIKDMDYIVPDGHHEIRVGKIRRRVTIINGLHKVDELSPTI